MVKEKGIREAQGTAATVVQGAHLQSVQKGGQVGAGRNIVAVDMAKKNDVSDTWMVCGAYICFYAGTHIVTHLHRGHKAPRCIKHGLLVTQHQAVNIGRVISRVEAKRLMVAFLDAGGD